MNIKGDISAALQIEQAQAAAELERSGNYANAVSAWKEACKLARAVGSHKEAHWCQSRSQYCEQTTLRGWE